MLFFIIFFLSFYVAVTAGNLNCINTLLQSSVQDVLLIQNLRGSFAVSPRSTISQDINKNGRTLISIIFNMLSCSIPLTIPNKDTFFQEKVSSHVATFLLVPKPFHVLGTNLCKLLLYSQLLLQRDILLLQGDVLLLQGLQQTGVTLLVLLQGRDGGIQLTDLGRHD